MPVKITSKIGIKRLPKRVKKNFALAIKAEIADKIVAKIISGKSPVEGESFADYTDKYAKIKGRKAPVDMLVSGKMLESIRVNQNAQGSLIVKFLSVIAGYQQKKRKLLPTKSGSNFTPDIMRFILSKLKKAVKREAKK